MPLIEKTNRVWLAQTVSFLWGFAFINLFRYTLDNIYPFFGEYIRLSLFVYLLAAIIWLSYWWYFHLHTRSRKSKFFYIIIGSNALIFFILSLLFSSTDYLFWLPLFFSFQVLLQNFLLVSRLPFFIAYNLALFAGIIAGIYPLPFMQNAVILMVVTGLLGVFPPHLIETEGQIANEQKTRMRPLRESLDMLRFLLLAFSLYGVFDIYRERFYLVVGIIISGAVVQHIILKYNTQKHHIKYGLVWLGILFILSGGLYQFIPFTYFTALGYVALTIWESIYFNRQTRAYMRREQLMAGIALIAVIFLYFITQEWAVLLMGILVVAVQLRIAFYIFKSYRQTIGTVFVISLVLWGWSWYNKLETSFTRDFFAELQVKKEMKKLPGADTLALVDEGETVITNILPQSVIENTAESTTYLKSFEYIDQGAPFFTMWMYLTFEKNQNVTYMIDLRKLPPYQVEPGKSSLKRFVEVLSPKKVFFIDQAKNSVNTEIIIYDESMNMITAPDIKDNEKAKKFFFELTRNSAEWYEKQDQITIALEKYQSLLEQYPANTEVLHRAARLSSIAGKVTSQIEYLNRLIAISNNALLKEKRQLMELYYWQGDYESSLAWAERLGQIDMPNRFTYLKWKFKNIKRNPTHRRLEQLYSEVRLLPIAPDRPEYIEKETLLRKIKEEIAANPAWHDIIQEELKRQETLQLPD